MMTFLIIYLLWSILDEISSTHYDINYNHREVKHELKKISSNKQRFMHVTKTKPDGTTYSATFVWSEGNWKEVHPVKRVIYHNRVETVWSDGSTEVRKAKRQIKHGKIVIRYKDGTTETVERWKYA